MAAPSGLPLSGFDASSVDTNLVGGRLLADIAHTDASIFIGPDYVKTFTGAWTLTRNAAFQYYLRHTAAVNTCQITIPISAFVDQRLAANKGFVLNSVDVIYQIATADITTHSWDCKSVAFANNVAWAAVAYGGSWTGTLAVAYAGDPTGPYVTRLTPGSPTWINTVDTALFGEITIVGTASGVYDFYGVFINFSYNWH